MIKVKVVEDFRLEAFKEISDITRANPNKNENGKLYENDTFSCDEPMAKYLLGDNPLKKAVVEVIEVIPEKEVKKIEEKTKKTTKKKKTTN